VWPARSVDRMKHDISRSCEGEPGVAVVVITLAALCLAILIAPGISNVTPAIECAFLLLLLLRGSSDGRVLQFARVSFSHLPRSTWRFAVFFFLELIAFGLMWTLERNGAESHPHLSFAIFRYSVVIPGLILMPISEWRRFGSVHRAECVAAGIALLTFYPYRIFTFSWPFYSQTLGRLVYALAHPFVPSLQFVPGTSPVLAGSGIDTTIIFACRGLQAIKLFQILFGFMLIMDWKVLNYRRVLTGYVAGLVIALMANAARIALLVVLGNRVSPALVERYHVNAGWVFFTLVFVLGLLATYNWLRGPALTGSERQGARVMPLAASTDVDIAH